MYTVEVRILPTPLSPSRERKLLCIDCETGSEAAPTEVRWHNTGAGGFLGRPRSRWGGDDGSDGYGCGRDARGPGGEMVKTSVSELQAKGAAARRAARALARLPAGVKDRALLNVAGALASRREEILDANRRDCDGARRNGLDDAMLDRLLITPERLDGIAGDLGNVVALPDPVGEMTDVRTMPNGMQVGRRRVPLGVIGAIYESRPNITVDISALCLKSGNSVILRGGREAIRTNGALASVIRDGIEAAGAPRDAVQLVESTDRALVGEMLGMKGVIDLVIPRGGQELIRRVAEEASMPAVTGGVGVCHTYVDGAADLDMAVEIVFNAKVQRPTVCNAMDSLIVHSAVAPAYLPLIAARWAPAGVQMRCDRRAMSVLGPDPARRSCPPPRRTGERSSCRSGPRSGSWTPSTRRWSTSRRTAPATRRRSSRRTTPPRCAS